MYKVCHLTSAHKSQDVRILKKQCTSLAKAGYDVYLVASGESYEENGVKVVGVGEIGGGRLKRMTQMTNRVYKKALELDCDIYQLHDPELLPYATRLKKKNKKVIFDSHENYALQIQQKKYLPLVFRKAISESYVFYSQKIFKKIDGLIFPCLENGINIFENKCKRVFLIGNEPMANELCGNEFDYSEKSGNTVCYVGALSYNRGAKHVVEACEISKADKLILAGTFDSKELQAELTQTNKFGVVDFRGRCNRDQVIEVLASSSIGMATLLNSGQYNKYDNFATKVYEYMAMGLPVIISDYAFSRKVNEQYNFAILVEPENIQEIANAINYLLENPEIAKQMGQNGRRAVEEEYNWATQEKKLLTLYKELSGEVHTDKPR